MSHNKYMGLDRQICAAVHDVEGCAECKTLFINCMEWEKMRRVRRVVIKALIERLKRL